MAAALRHGGLDCTIIAVAAQREFEMALDEAAVDVILADDRLPAFDCPGPPQIARAKAPLIPFIFVSGTLGEEVAVERIREGAVDYVLKQRLARLPGSVDPARHC